MNGNVAHMTTSPKLWTKRLGGVHDQFKLLIDYSPVTKRIVQVTLALSVVADYVVELQQILSTDQSHLALLQFVKPARLTGQRAKAVLNEHCVGKVNGYKIIVNRKCIDGHEEIAGSVGHCAENKATKWYVSVGEKKHATHHSETAENVD